MRDSRWIALHRGGQLSIEHHRALQLWSIGCVEALLEALSLQADDTIMEALDVASAWSEGRCKTGASMQTARALHKRARSQSTPVEILLLRATAHAVATAHAADHCLGAIIYGCKALQTQGMKCDAFVQTCRENLEDLAPQMVDFVFEQLTLKTQGKLP